MASGDPWSDSAPAARPAVRPPLPAALEEKLAKILAYGDSFAKSSVEVWTADKAGLDCLYCHLNRLGKICNREIPIWAVRSVAITKNTNADRLYNDLFLKEQLLQLPIRCEDPVQAPPGVRTATTAGMVFHYVCTKDPGGNCTKFMSADLKQPTLGRATVRPTIRVLTGDIVIAAARPGEEYCGNIECEKKRACDEFACETRWLASRSHSTRELTPPIDSGYTAGILFEIESICGETGASILEQAIGLFNGDPAADMQLVSIDDELVLSAK